MARNLGKRLVGLARIHVPNPPFLAQKTLAELKELQKLGGANQFDVAPKKEFERRTVGKHQLPNVDEKEITTAISFFDKEGEDYPRAKETETVRKFKGILKKARARGFFVREYGGPDPVVDK